MLKILFDRSEVPQYHANASCDKCETIINLDRVYTTGFLHCKICDYNVCNECRYGGAKEQANEELIEVEETVEMSDNWSVDNQPKTVALGPIAMVQEVDEQSD